jgi:hypothetical protein
MSRSLAVSSLRWVFACCVFVQSVISLSCMAQDVKINAGFITDSLKIGEQTRFFLAAHYPSDLNILFPDSTFGFSPFEYQKRNYFPTQTENGVSVDSAVYYLTTFEVDRVQYLDLPVFAVQPQDCTIFVSPRDSVLITQMVAEVPDSLSADKLPLKMNTAYQNVAFEFNYLIALIAVAALVLIAIVVWMLFGKRIRTWMVTKRMQKKHFQFLEAFNRAIVQLKPGFSAPTTETALATWKRYMEQLESKPYTKLTTKETHNLIHDQALALTLSRVDRAIYGHETAVIDSLEALRLFADQQFSKKLEEIKHG